MIDLRWCPTSRAGAAVRHPGPRRVSGRRVAGLAAYANDARRRPPPVPGPDLRLAASRANPARPATAGV